LARYTGNALAPFKAVRLWLAGLGYVRAPLGAANLHANATQRHEPSRETLAAFARVATLQKIGPRMGDMPRPFVSDFLLVGEVGQAEVLALR
jgi:hypothetical protein